MFTRIKPPKFRIGRYVLNEYELRTLMAEVAEGRKPAGYKVREGQYSAVIESTGRLLGNLPGLTIATEQTFRLLRVHKGLKEGIITNAHNLKS